MIRIVGTFRAVSGGSTVDYRIEWMPAALIAVVIAFVISIPIIALLIWLRYVPLEALAPLLVIIPLVAAANIWLSERQAKWLQEFILRELDGIIPVVR